MVDTSNRTVTVSKLKNAIERCVKVKRPVFIWGPPGVGKSDSVAQLCKSMGGRLYDIRLSLLEPTDLRGMPYYNKDSGKMEWAPPIDLPDADTASKYPIVFLLFDEMNSAAPSVQAACYQIALNRRVGTYELPENVVIIAAGNRDGDKGVTYRMPSPLANRFVHLELRVDFEDWKTWALDHMIHKDVVSFLEFSKNSLYDFDPSSPNKSFATPRSWEFVSQLLDDEVDDNTMTDIVSGAIGQGLALSFMKHREVADKMPKPKSILDGSITQIKINNLSAHYSLSVSCCYELRDMWEKYGNTKSEDKYNTAMNNFLKFVMDNFQTELSVMSMKGLMGQNIPIKPEKTPEFQRYYSQFGHLILKASS